MTTFICDLCKKKTKNPIWTPDGVLCRECVNGVSGAGYQSEGFELQNRPSNLTQRLVNIFGHDVDCGVIRGKDCDCSIHLAVQEIRNYLTPPFMHMNEAVEKLREVLK